MNWRVIRHGVDAEGKRRDDYIEADAVTFDYGSALFWRKRPSELTTPAGEPFTEDTLEVMLAFAPGQWLVIEEVEE